MAYPKITYVDANGDAQVLLFQMPPVKHPAAWKTAERTDSFATAGDKQSWHQRTDNFLDINMSYATRGEEIESWNQFLDFALTGDEFEYYPDADADVHETYTLDDTDYKPEFAFLDTFQFQLKLRKAV